MLDGRCVKRPFLLRIVDAHLTFRPRADGLPEAHVHFVVLQQTLGDLEPPEWPPRQHQQIQTQLSRCMSLAEANRLEQLNGIDPVSFGDEFSEGLTVKVVKRLDALLLHSVWGWVGHADLVYILACKPWPLCAGPHTDNCGTSVLETPPWPSRRPP